MLTDSTYEEILRENEGYKAKITRLEVALKIALDKIKWLEEQLILSRHRHFAKKSEAASTFQDEVEPEMGEDSEQTPEPLSLSDITVTYTRKKANKKKGRNIDTSTLPRYRELHDLPEHHKNCSICGHALHKICEDITEQLEIIPRHVYVVEHVRPQYGCRHCETVIAAPKPLAPIPKSLAGASLLTDVILSKYEYHLPLYRQSKLFKHFKIDLADNTLGHWVMQSGEALLPLDDVLCQVLQATSYLQVDETPVKLLSPEKQAYMWCYLSPLPTQQLVRFRFDLTRSKEVPQQDLGGFKGILQTDGYAGYQALREKAGITGCGCLAHSRRKFVEIIKVVGTQVKGKAHEALEFITALYQIEGRAREEDFTFAARKNLRQKEAKPILEKFHTWLLQTQPRALPQSALCKAIDYTLNQWPYLQAYADHGEVEIDTNWVENKIRPFALGRRNWLFLGHEGSAQISALFYSLIQSALLNQLNPRVYLHYLLTQVHALRQKRIDPVLLLPHRIDKEKLDQFAQEYFNKIKHLFPAFT